mgnify:CR=1 FL=1
MSKENTELKKAGLKATLPRIRILEALESSDNRHLSAEDIYKQLITFLGFKFWYIFDDFFFDFAIFRRPGKAIRYYKYNTFVAFAPLAAKCTIQRSACDAHGVKHTHYDSPLMAFLMPLMRLSSS